MRLGERHGPRTGFCNNAGKLPAKSITCLSTVLLKTLKHGAFDFFSSKNQREIVNLDNFETVALHEPVENIPAEFKVGNYNPEK